MRHEADPREIAEFQGNVTVHYAKVGANPPLTGVGQMVAVDDSQVCFTTLQTLSEGDRLQVALQWPAVGASPAMKLRAWGTITRVEARLAILLMDRYEFLTGQDEAADMPGAVTVDLNDLPCEAGADMLSLATGIPVIGTQHDGPLTIEFLQGKGEQIDIDGFVHGRVIPRGLAIFCVGPEINTLWDLPNDADSFRKEHVFQGRPRKR